MLDAMTRTGPSARKDFSTHVAKGDDEAAAGLHDRSRRHGCESSCETAFFGKELIKAETQVPL